MKRLGSTASRSTAYITMACRENLAIGRYSQTWRKRLGEPSSTVQSTHPALALSPHEERASRDKLSQPAELSDQSSPSPRPSDSAPSSWLRMIVLAVLAHCVHDDRASRFSPDSAPHPQGRSGPARSTKATSPPPRALWVCTAVLCRANWGKAGSAVVAGTASPVASWRVGQGCDKKPHVRLPPSRHNPQPFLLCR